MALCPHCANPIEEGEVSCPFCKAPLTRRGATHQSSNRQGSSTLWIGATLFLSLLVLGLIVALIWQGGKGPRGDQALFPAHEETDRQVRELGNQVAKLRKELEETSRQIIDLKARVEETTRSLASVQQRPRSARTDAERPAPPPASPSGRTVSRPAEIPPTPAQRRPAEPGTYEVLRTTSVYDEPSRSARKLTTISGGTKITVVGSAGEWLEVRSKHGNPPGFILRDDAMFVQPRN